MKNTGRIILDLKSIIDEIDTPEATELLNKVITLVATSKETSAKEINGQGSPQIVPNKAKEYEYYSGYEASYEIDKYENKQGI